MTMITCSCFVFQVVNECGCRALGYLNGTFYELYLLARDITACDSYSHSWNVNFTVVDYFKWAACFTNTYFLKSNDGCTRKCIPPCREHQYKSHVYVSGPWPHSVYVRQFYDTYIRRSYIDEEITSVCVSRLGSYNNL